MPTVHRYKHLYSRVPENIVEYLYYKFQKLEGSNISKDRHLEQFLDILSSAIKNPIVTMVGEHKFSKVMYVEDLRIPIGFRVEANKRTVSVCRDYRLGITSSGELIGDSVDTSERNNVLTVSFEMTDKDYYCLPSTEAFTRHGFWHKNFMSKVLNMIDDLSPEQIELLVRNHHFSGDNPREILQREWMHNLKEKVSIYCHRDDTKPPIVPADMRIADMLNVEFNPGDDIKAKASQYMYGSTPMTDIAIDRFVEWSLFKDTPIEDILNYTIRELLEDFITRVDVKANKLRDEVLTRYGFTMSGNKALATDVERLMFGIANRDSNGGMVEVDMRIARVMAQIGYTDKSDVQWSKKHGKDEVVIDEGGTVYINRNRICIIGSKGDSQLPMGDKIVQRVFAVGTNIRDDIYTLNNYRGILQNMFEGGERYEEGQGKSGCQG